MSYRVRWSILIGNLDGHTSELRCSLPIHVLDYRLAEEARVATLATRRLLLGAGDVDGGEAVLIVSPPALSKHVYGYPPPLNHHDRWGAATGEGRLGPPSGHLRLRRWGEGQRGVDLSSNG